MMKKLIVLTTVVIALALGGASAWAQMPGGHPGPGQPMSPDQRLQMMTKQLNLTADQQEKIKPLLESQNQQMQTLRQDSSLSREDRMTKMQEIRQSTNDQIKSALDADQQKKFEQTMSRPARGGPGQNPVQPQ
jgi:protein CpxP